MYLICWFVCIVSLVRVCMWKTGQSWKAISIRTHLHFWLWCMDSQCTRTCQGGWTCFHLPNTGTPSMSHHVQLLSHRIWDSSSCPHESTLLSALPSPININFYTNANLDLRGCHSIQMQIQDWNQNHDFPENIVSGFMKSIHNIPLFEWVFHLGPQHFLTSCWNSFDVGTLSL